jgi:uncharacterized protein
MCRFTGHTSEFYSVAQHSVLVSKVVRPSVALAGLMHDAAEAYMGDIARPWKRFLRVQVERETDAGLIRIEGSLKEVEHLLLKAIFERFGIQSPDAAPGCIFSTEVEHADTVLLVTEARDLLSPVVEDWHRTRGYSEVEPLGEKIVPWSPLGARNAFIARFNELTGEGVPLFK